jgi:hypothetical protein
VKVLLETLELLSSALQEHTHWLQLLSEDESKWNQEFSDLFCRRVNLLTAEIQMQWIMIDDDSGKLDNQD